MRSRSKTRLGARTAAPDTYELSREAKDDLACATFGDPANLEVYDPRASQRLPPEGAWSMITRELPPLEGRLDEQLRVGRIFFLERLENADASGFLPGGLYKVRCRSPWGDLCLWPYEYAVLGATTVIELWSAEEIVFHPTNIDQARFSDIAFYARSRGIGLGEAAVMALGTLAGPVGWFEPRADLAGACESTARSVHDPNRYNFLRGAEVGFSRRRTRLAAR